MISQRLPLFVPDDRNLGGITQIEYLKFNHKRALKNVKPVVNSLVPPFSHVDKQRYQSASKQRSPYAPEVSKISRPVTSQANRTYVSFPVTSRKYRRRDSFIREEHERNYSIMKYKIKNVGKSMLERKKRPWDPIAKPVYLFRHTKEKPKLPMDTMDLPNNDFDGRFFSKIRHFSTIQPTGDTVQTSLCLDGMSVYQSSHRRQITQTIKQWHKGYTSPVARSYEL